MIAVNRVHFPVRSLGFGARVGVWLQGCSIRCRGCVVPETWESSPYFYVSIDDLLGAAAPWLREADGVTISGGEPFDQPEALHALLERLRAIRGVRDLLVYSGYPLTRLWEHFGATLKLIDVVIAGPFVATLPDTRPFVGSSNQEIALLTDLARARYGDSGAFERGMGVDVRDGALLFAGVPERGHLAALAAAINASGTVEARLTHDPV